MNTPNFDESTGFKGPEDLSRIAAGETPQSLAARLLGKTGPVADTINQYSIELRLEPGSLQATLLQVAGSLVSALGRRAQRKFPDADPKEFMDSEWGSALRARNFIATIINGLNIDGMGKIDLLMQIQPSWQELKPAVQARLMNASEGQISPLNSFNVFRQNVLLAKYDYLERTSLDMCEMTLNACDQGGVEPSIIKGLTERIITLHYPRVPEYQPALVHILPLAYETRVLNLWNQRIENLLEKDNNQSTEVLER